ncbi:hypothetical protein B0H14DRAFT_3138996 [Mycena olivaceomarginata]|nr:hypothetical protein B0H14DRAFT_3138996 [Mycena olivaceomarginata]
MHEPNHRYHVWARGASRGGLRLASFSVFTQTKLGVRTAASSPTWGISKAAVAVGQSSVYPEADWVRERDTAGLRVHGFDFNAAADRAGKVVNTHIVVCLGGRGDDEAQMSRRKVRRKGSFARGTASDVRGSTSGAGRKVHSYTAKENGNRVRPRTKPQKLRFLGPSTTCIRFRRVSTVPWALILSGVTHRPEILPAHNESEFLAHLAVWPLSMS